MQQSKIVCLGDSLTEGYGIAQTACWTTLLEAEIGIEVENRGISGDTTTGMLARFQQHVLAAQPTHLILMGGTNDLWFGLSTSLLLSNYHAMIRYARLHHIITIIGIPLPVLATGINDDAPGLYASQIELSKALDAFRTVLKSYAEDQILLSIDFGANMEEAHFMADGVHPNEAGNKLMMKNAAKVWRTM